MAEDLIRVEIGFAGGQILSWLVTPDSADALDRNLGPLPAGRYRVVVGVGQDDPEWLATSAGTSFTLVVAGTGG